MNEQSQPTAQSACFLSIILPNSAPLAPYRSIYLSLGIIMTNKQHIETQLISLGRDPLRDKGSVNPPVHRTSTVLFENYADYAQYELGKSDHKGYGRYGTPSSDSLEAALAALEGANYALTFSSGLSAVTTSMLAFASAGDHVLIVDSVYASTRKFCENELPRMGVDITYYAPSIGAEIADLFKENTKYVFCESPGSLTFEMQDIPLIAKIAHEKGALVLADNTWATMLHQKPFAMGIDVSIHSATKYVAGHSDVLIGAVTLQDDALYQPLRRAHHNFGGCAQGDACYLALRGLRTMALRLEKHQQNALKVAHWLEQQPLVKRVLFPALESSPDYALFKRDLTGACGLFGLELGVVPEKAIAAFIDGLHHFGVGFSWGGFESLIIAYQPHNIRSTTKDKWQKGSYVLRLNIGLENVEDIIADLDAALKRLEKAL
jgi:cystathionine beta-lyase